MQPEFCLPLTLATVVFEQEYIYMLMIMHVAFSMTSPCVYVHMCKPDSLLSLEKDSACII